MPSHEVLRESLAPLESGRRFRGTNNRSPHGVERIDHASAQRELRTDDGEIDILTVCDGEQLGW
jgi:hypothetical protein